MVTNELAEENFVRGDRLGLSQLELDRSSRAKRLAVPLTFAGGIRISGSDAYAIGLGIIRATRCR
jgi:hypothetical protein